MLAFLLVGLVPAAAGGLLGARQSLRATQAARLESEERLIALSAEAVAATLRNGLWILEAAAQDDHLRRMAAADDRAMLGLKLREIRTHYPDLASVLVLNASGVLLASGPDASAIGQGFRYLDYYQGVLRSHSPYISPVPFQAGATRIPSLAVAAPILGPRGDLRGVLAATFALENLSQLLDPHRSGGQSRTDRGVIYLVAPSGTILAHSDPAKWATPVAENDAGARAALAGRQGSVTWTASDGTGRTSVFAPLPKLGWGLVYTQTASSWLSALSDPFPGILPALLVVLVMAVVGGTLAARHLSRPILRLQEAASRLRDGDFSARLPENRQDELGDLAAAFNRTAASLQELYNNLEAKVAERTAILKSTNLELARASQVKSEFLARMSHDLRTPLNAIIGFTDLLLTAHGDPLTNHQRRYLGHVANASRHLLDLINDILDLTRVEAGRLEIHPVPCRVAPLLEEVLALFRKQAQDRRISLTLEVGSPLGELLVDRVRLQQVLHNLLSNALKFTPDGGMIALAAQQIGLEQEFTVRDTGPGIPGEDQERIFEAYEQAGTPEGQQRGSGLGLAITKRLVELHGGKIWVESAVGQGSVFKVRMPGASAVEGEPQASGTPGHLVLVIEDELQTAEMIRAHLTRGGYRVALVASGHAGVGAAKRLQPQAIILDLGLPDLDGWEVLYRLKRDPATQDIPVLIVSAQEQGRLGLSLGAVDWLLKPLDHDRLMAALQRCRELGVPTRSFRILVVDDEPAVLEALEALLAKEGHTIWLAQDGDEALRRAEQDPPDIVLLDLHLPGLSGFEVVNRLRRIPGMETAPIIAFSGKFVSSEERTMLTQQAVQFVGKYGAVTLNRLLEDLRRISFLAN